MRFCINVLCPSVSVSLLILLNDESIIWEKPPQHFPLFRRINVHQSTKHTPKVTDLKGKLR